MSRQTPSEIHSEAARWVARMDADDWDAAADAQLGEWLARDERHGGALLEAQALWTALGGPAEAESASVGYAPPQPGQTSRRWLLAGAGATLAASLVGGIVFYNRADTYSTALGEIRRVPLADGSIAAINTSSEIKVALAADRREVRLEQGEVWFQVAKDRARPFVVSAGNVRVEAVGTAFSVRRRDGGADVIVTEGVVEAWAAGADGHKIRIAAGSMAFVADNAAIKEEPAIGAAADRALAWRSGKIDLAGTRVDEAVAEFNRYNRRRILIADPAVGGERFDGVFRTDDPEGFAQVVSGSLGVPADLSDPSAITIGRQSGVGKVSN